MRRHLHHVVCLCIAALLCSLHLAFGFQSLANNYARNAHTRLQPRQLRISGAGLGYMSRRYVHHRGSAMRSTELRFQGDDQLAGSLSHEEKVRLEAIEAFFLPPGIRKSAILTLKLIL